MHIKASPFSAIFLFLLLTSCGRSGIQHAQFPLSVTWTEGDDGQIINTLRIDSAKGRFFAVETESDNFSQPGIRNRLRNDSLTAQQLHFLDSFLMALQHLPDSCGSAGAFVQRLDFSQPGFTKTVRGGCNTGTASYNALRQKLFGKSLYEANTGLGCIDVRDTSFPNGDYLRYVSQGDTVLDLKVGMGGHDALLGFGFKCPVPSVLIPKVFRYSKAERVLVRGSGFHFRESIVCRPSTAGIQIKQYETERSINPHYDGVIVPDSKDSTYFILTELGSRKQWRFKSQTPVSGVERFEINGSALFAVVGDHNEVVLLPDRLKR